MASKDAVACVREADCPPSTRRRQTCDFRKRATSVPAELGGEIHHVLQKTQFSSSSCVFTFLCFLHAVISLLTAQKLTLTLGGEQIQSAKVLGTEDFGS